MKHIHYTSLNGTNFLAIIAFIVGFSIAIYMGESIMFSFAIAFGGLLFMRFLTFTKCFKFSYDEREIVLINAIFPPMEYRYKVPDLKEIYIDDVAKWGAGVVIKDKTDRKMIFGISGSDSGEIYEMVDFINAKIKERKNESK
ncbi:hypothetical protein QYS48_10230 [Marivirga arenosa]|uniref:Uncharacterized protein n=1 Tax=Marivirga arenosa TaxID=3059076 RepID=A0AA49GF46_9BACT|nr:hypothetical protein [Marivirga sp. ABR2-2]WKK87147.2 hypothetical protein QYS48_10230 [Marivirga sp. ABR2-2]